MIIPESYEDRVQFVIMGLVAIGAVLRFYMLDANALWIDEAWTLFASTQPWHLTMFSDIHPPVYYWLVKIGVMIFGTEEWGIRMISALFGIIAIPLTYLLGKRIGNTIVGLSAAALLTFSPFHIFYSQEARMYTFITVLFILFTLAYFRATEKREYSTWFIVGALGALMVWSYYYMAIPVLIAAAHSVFYYYKDIKQVVFGWMTTGVLTVPILIPFYQAFITKVYVEGSNLSMGLHGFDIITTTITNFSYNLVVLAIASGVLAILGWFVLWDSNKHDPMVEWIGFQFVGMFATAAIFSNFILIHQRYFLFLLPLFYILLSCGLILLTTKATQDRTLIALVITLFIAVSTVGVFQYYEKPHNPEMRGIYDELYPITEQGDTLALLVNRGYFELFTYYYDVRGDGVIVVKYERYSDLVKLCEESEGDVFAFVPPEDPSEEMREAVLISQFVKANGYYVTTLDGWAVFRIPKINRPYVVAVDHIGNVIHGQTLVWDWKTQRGVMVNTT